MIRVSAIVARGGLERRGFKRDDFKIHQESRSDDGFFLRIEFIPSNNFFIEAIAQERPPRAPPVVVDKKQSFPIKVKVAPGELYGEESLSLASVSTLLDTISAWVQRIDEEMQGLVQSKSFMRLQEEIKTWSEKMNGLRPGPFTTAEIDTLTARLNELESRMAKNLEEVYKDKQALGEKVQQVHGDIETLKSRLEALDRPGWFKTFMTRASTWMKDPANQKMLKSGAEIAKTLLGDGK